MKLFWKEDQLTLDTGVKEICILDDPDREPGQDTFVYEIWIGNTLDKAIKDFQEASEILAMLKELAVVSDIGATSDGETFMGAVLISLEIEAEIRGIDLKAIDPYQEENGFEAH